MKSGFFVKEDARKAKRKIHTPKGAVSIDTVRRLGVKAVRNMNPHAKNPNIKPGGCTDEPRLYVLTAAPGPVEDGANEHAMGPGGQYLRDTIPAWLEEGSCFDAVCRTRPSGDRQPSLIELEAFRDSVEKSIEKMQPEAILVCGNIPLVWLYGSFSKRQTINAFRGRRIPVKIRSHTCWAYPVYDIAFMGKIQKSKKKGAKKGKVPSKEALVFFEKDIKRVAREIKKGLPEVPWVELDEKLLEPVTIIERPSGKLLKKGLAELDEKCKPWSIDIETTGLRPYKKDATILCVSISDGKRSIAIALDHPGVVDTSGRRAFIQSLRKLVMSECLIAHNAKFELEWFLSVLGTDAIDCDWLCTMAAAYILDERLGALSMDYLALQEFGFRIKQATRGASFRASLAEQPLDEVLKYCGVDSLWTKKLELRLGKRIKSRTGLTEAYKRQNERVKTLAMAQFLGLPISKSARDEIHGDLTSRLKKLEKEFEALPEVKRFQRERLERFQPSKALHIFQIFGQFGQQLVNEAGNRSSDEDVLKPLIEEFPIAGMILDYRRWTKLESTYVGPLYHDHEKSIIWPDGLIHCEFNATRAGTGRLTSSRPNNQNWPKRRDKFVRRVITVPNGYTMLAIDYGQIEARVIATASRDEMFCKALWDGFDIHTYWSEILDGISPGLIDRFGGMKELRSKVKNAAVFPAFYGAGEPSVAHNMGIDFDAAAEFFGLFWEKHHGVPPWQQDLLEGYNKTGYVSCLTGRRRHGPLSPNMVLNSPIQGTASDIVMDGMDRCRYNAREMDKPWLYPILNIHDEIITIVPNEKLEDAIEISVETMLSFKADWLIVPLAVEVEVGQDWSDMEDVGTFDSTMI